MKLSVVIPSWNTRELLRVCLQRLSEAELPAHEVIVVDNGSADDSADMVAADFPEVVLIRHAKNEGFAGGCNAGMRVAKGEQVLLLNTDTEVAPDAVARLIAHLDAHPEYGATAPRLIHPDGRLQPACKRFPTLLTALFYGPPLETWWPKSPPMERYYLRDWDHLSDRDVDQPPAAVLLVRNSVLAEIGLFDETLWLFYNDVDLSRRMADAGYKTRYLTDAVVIHHEGASTSKFDGFLPIWHQNRLAYYRKHYGLFGSLWIKGCVGLTVSHFALQQMLNRLRGRGYEALGPKLKLYRTFLGQ